ncbi:MAG: hypothetical protein NSGCLCUN01_01447 [uncultured Clostridium sp.]
MKAKTREKMMYGITIFMLIVFLISLLPAFI